jgi:hypothetical protein
MIKSKHLRVVVLTGLLIFFVFTTTAKAEISAKQGADELLRMIPADSLFCVRVNNLGNSLSQTDQFLTGVSPMPMFLSMLVRGQLAGLLGSPELTGLNMSGSFAIFAVTTASEPPGTKPSDMFIGVLAPITDYKQFIDGNSNLSPPDANGISKIKSGESAGTLIKQVGNYALFGSGNSSRFAEMAKSISDGKTTGIVSVLDTNDVNRAAKEPIWAYGNIQLVSKTFGEKIRTGLEEIKTEMSSAKPKRQTRIDVNDMNVCLLADADGDKKLTTDEIDQQITKLKTEMNSKQQNIQEMIKQLEQQESQPADSNSNMRDAVKEQIENLKKIIDDSNRDMQSRIDRLERIKSRLAGMGPGQKGAIEELARQVEDVNAPSANPQAEKLAVNGMNMYAAILETLLKETKSLSLTVRPEPNLCNMAMSISAMPGTDMANIFVADASAGQENKLLGYLENGTVMNFAGKMNTPFWKLNTKGINLMSAMMGESAPAEDIAKLKALVEKAAGATGDSMAGSFWVDTKNKPPFRCKYVATIKDEEKFNQLIEEGSQMMNTGTIAKFYKSLGIEMGFTIKRAVDNYKGVSIDSAKLVMNSTEPNSPEGQIINAMYAGGFDYRWAFVDGLCVCVMGGDVESAIRELIDQVKAGGPKQLADEAKAALSLIPQASKADFVGTYNLLRWLKIIGTMTLMPMPQMDIPTSSNIVFAAKIADGKMTSEIALPKKHLMEMMGMFQAMQQQQMPKKEIGVSPHAETIPSTGK